MPQKKSRKSRKSEYIHTRSVGIITAKTSGQHEKRTRRSRNPWSSKNFKLLGSALRVWELKERNLKMGW